MRDALRRQDRAALRHHRARRLLFLLAPAPLASEWGRGPARELELTVSTLYELYSGSAELFEGLWAGRHWDFPAKRRPVIWLQFSSSTFQVVDLPAAIQLQLSRQAARLGVDLPEHDNYALRFQQLIEAAVPYQLWARKSEAMVHAILHTTFTMLGLYTRSDVSTSRGRADMVVKVPNYVFIIELKLGGTAAEALTQIEARGYAKAYADDAREVIRFGIALDVEARQVMEWAEAESVWQGAFGLLRECAPAPRRHSRSEPNGATARSVRSRSKSRGSSRDLRTVRPPRLRVA